MPYFLSSGLRLNGIFVNEALPKSFIGYRIFQFIRFSFLYTYVHFSKFIVYSNNFFETGFHCVAQADFFFLVGRGLNSGPTP